MDYFPKRSFYRALDLQRTSGDSDLIRIESWFHREVHLNRKVLLKIFDSVI